MAAAERVLFIGSGAPDHVRRALDRFAHTWPEAHVELAIRPEALEVLSPSEQKQVIYVAGHKQGRLAFVRACRAAGYDRTIVLFAGDAGFGALKLSAFLCGGRKLLCYNENGDAFIFGWSHRAAIWRHTTWRLGLARLGVGGAAERLALSLTTSLMRRALGPVGLALLIGRTLSLLLQLRLRRAAAQGLLRQSAG